MIVSDLSWLDWLLIATCLPTLLSFPFVFFFLGKCKIQIVGIGAMKAILLIDGIGNLARLPLLIFVQQTNIQFCVGLAIGINFTIMFNSFLYLCWGGLFDTLKEKGKRTRNFCTVERLETLRLSLCSLMVSTVGAAIGYQLHKSSHVIAYCSQALIGLALLFHLLVEIVAMIGERKKKTSSLKTIVDLCCKLLIDLCTILIMNALIQSVYMFILGILYFSSFFISCAEIDLLCRYQARKSKKEKKKAKKAKKMMKKLKKKVPEEQVPLLENCVVQMDSLE